MQLFEFRRPPCQLAFCQRGKCRLAVLCQPAVSKHTHVLESRIMSVTRTWRTLWCVSWVWSEISWCAYMQHCCGRGKRRWRTDTSHIEWLLNELVVAHRKQFRQQIRRAGGRHCYVSVPNYPDFLQFDLLIMRAIFQLSIVSCSYFSLLSRFSLLL